MLVARLLLVFSMSAFLLGCPPRNELSLWNNTEEDLVLLVGRSRVAWVSGQVVKFGDDDGMSWNQLAVKTGPDG